MSKKNEKNEKSWFRRHPILTVILGLVILGMIGSFLEKSEEVVKTNSLTLDSQTDLTQIILPNDKIPTKYYLSEKEFELNETGFITGYKKNLAESDGFSGTAITIAFSKFSETSQSLNYYNKLTNEIKDARGYEEKTVYSPFECFAYKKELGMNNQNEVICYKDNIVFSIKGIGFMYWYDLEDLFDLQKEHLLN